MKKISIIGAVLAAGILATWGSAAWAIEPVAGDYTFTFTGQCSDCAGQSTATLKVSDYVLGSDLTVNNLVDFKYSSNLTSLDINPATEFFLIEDSLSGSITTTPGSYNVDVAQLFLGIFPETEFNSSTDGAWSVSNNVPEDLGINGVWNGAISAAPEPSVWIMMLSGVALMGAALRFGRRRNAVALAA